MKYVVVPGSSMRPLLLRPEARAFVVVEAELDAMACVDTVKDDDGNDTYRPTEEAAITINSVTITTYSSAEDNGLDAVG